MGYYSHVYGEITFDPPLTHEDVEGLDVGEGIFRFRVFETETTVMGGVLKSKGSCAIETAYEDEIKAYDVEGDLNRLITQLPGRVFRGEFRIEGEEQGDMRRVFIDMDHKVVEWRPTITWPDGEVERSPR